MDHSSASNLCAKRLVQAKLTTHALAASVIWGSWRQGVGGILESGTHSGRQDLIDALENHGAPNANPMHQTTDRCTVRVAQQNAGAPPLHVSMPFLNAQAQ